MIGMLRRQGDAEIAPGWSVDNGDPDVGIFGTEFIHEDCPVYADGGEYDAGCTYDTQLVGKVDRSGCVVERYTVTCHDCGQGMCFTDKVFVGFDDYPDGMN